MKPRPALRTLAERAGILDGYRSALDGSWVATADATREALLAAMGLDASGEAAAHRALAELEAEREVERVDPLRVVVAGRPEARRLALHAHAGFPAGSRVALSIEAEEGAGFAGDLRIDAAGEVERPELAPGR